MIKLTEILQDIIAEKKLCPKGKAYYNRRRAAGEKPSAYLSGRAVKVCKGLMEEDDLEEAKQVGTLYHWTSLKNLANIIKTNTILPSHSGHGEYDWVSLTRSKDRNQFGISKSSDCVIVLDGDKLSNNYKIKPYHDIETAEYDDLTHFDDNGNAIGITDDDGNIIRYGAFDEMEERLFGSIRNLDKYIIKVILHESNSEIKSLLKEKNIPYELNLNESLRDWFKKEDWVRIDTAGNITGPCGTMKKGNKTTRCLPRAKANSLTKAERAATSKKKAASDKQFVPNTKKAKVKLNK
jgi:hypothetical protein